MGKVKPLPEDAKMVFKGVIFEVWQWQQKMFDGTTQTFERLKRFDTTSVIATMGDKIMLQEQMQPDTEVAYPSLPGGRFDEGEAPLECAQRELLEETGCTSDSWVLWKEYRPVVKIEWNVYFFIARDCTKKQDPKLDAGEKLETRLIDFEEFLALADEPNFNAPEITADLLRARLDPSKKEELRKLIFG